MLVRAMTKGHNKEESSQPIFEGMILAAEAMICKQRSKVDDSKMQFTQDCADACVYACDDFLRTEMKRLRKVSLNLLLWVPFFMNLMSSSVRARMNGPGPGSVACGSCVT